MPALTIFVEELSLGQLPTFDLPKDWFYPTYCIDQSGNNIVEFTKPKRIICPLFELSGSTESIKQEIADRITALVLYGQFAGTILMFIRTDFVIGTEQGPTRILNLGLAYTADFVLDSELGPGIEWATCPWKTSLPEIEQIEENLIDNRKIMDVMFS